MLSELKSLQGPENISCELPQGQMYTGEGQTRALRHQRGTGQEERALRWARPLFPVVEKLRQEGCKFEANLAALKEKKGKKKKRKTPIPLCSFPSL